jgi:hypothetical protein
VWGYIPVSGFPIRFYLRGDLTAAEHRDATYLWEQLCAVERHINDAITPTTIGITAPGTKPLYQDRIAFVRLKTGPIEGRIAEALDLVDQLARYTPAGHVPAHQLVRWQDGHRKRVDRRYELADRPSREPPNGTAPQTGAPEGGPPGPRAANGRCWIGTTAWRSWSRSSPRLTK